MKIKQTSFKVLGVLALFCMLSLNSCQKLLGCETCICDGDEYLACAEKDIAWYESTGCVCD